MACISIAAIAGAGVSAAGAAGAFSPSAPSAGQVSEDQLKAMIKYLPQVYQAQMQYDPLFAALQQNVQYQNLFGTPGTPASSTAAQPAGWYDASGSLVSSDRNYYSASAQGGSWWGRKGGTSERVPTGVTWRGQTATGTTPGTPGTPGMLGMMEQAAPRLTALGTAENTAIRGADVADVARLGPAARSAIAGYNPGATAMLDTLTNQAQQQLSLNGALDPFTKTMMAQDVNAGTAARGLGTGPADAAALAYYENAQRQANRAAAQTLATGTLGANQGYYGDPFMQILSRSSGQSSVPGLPMTGGTGNAFDQIPQSVQSLYGQAFGDQQATNAARYNSQVNSMANLFAPQGRGFGTLFGGLNAIFGDSNYYTASGALT
jgi:hypothetical protein